MARAVVLTLAVSVCGDGITGHDIFSQAKARADERTSPARFEVDDNQARPISVVAVRQPQANPPTVTVEGTTESGLRPANPRQPSRPFTARWADVTQRQVIRQSENWRLRWRDLDVSQRRENALTHEAPAQDIPAHDTPARQVELRVEERLATSSPTSNVHQARASNAATPRSEIETVRFTEPRRRKPAQVKQASNVVRFAAQQTTADPFADPFGDRSLPAPAERSSDEPAIIEPPRTPPAARSQGGFSPTPEFNEPSLPRANQFDPAPRTMPSDTTPFSYDPAPTPPDSALPNDPACDRVYNRRDCCKAGKECDEHRQRVRESPISNISLDITPRMTITQLERSNYDSERLRTMRRVPPRIWRNDDGETLADGRLMNFRYGRVEIETEDGLKKIPFADLSDDDMCFVTAWWSIPSECSLGNDPVIDRNWVASTMTFKASSLCHKPLYFEELNLERYGHTAGPLVQPVLSGAHFFVNVAALPYKMGINPPSECRYPLGYYRPGDCAPWLVRPVPLSIRGGLTAAATYVGGTLVIP